MYAFLRRPLWILSHVLIAALVVAMVVLGLWQRARWIEESGIVEQLDARAAAEPVPFDEVVAPGTAPAEVDPGLRFTRVQLRGTYDVGEEVAISNRSQGGAPGAWVLTPLVRADGSAVAVVRGWVPLAAVQDPPPFPDAAAPDGEVVLTGTVQPTQPRGSFGAEDAPDGELDALARVDLERLAQQLPYELAGAWVLLDDQAPAQPGPLPQGVDLVRGDPSQNFSYMVQWWIFAAIAAIGYPLVLRGVARHRLRERPADGPGGGPAPPGPGEPSEHGADPAVRGPG
jgi:cytochrome oxidase assembly protein ShyY1